MEAAQRDSRAGLFVRGPGDAGQQGEGHSGLAVKGGHGGTSAAVPRASATAPPSPRPHLTHQPLTRPTCEILPAFLVSEAATTVPTLPHSSARNLPPLTWGGPEALPCPQPYCPSFLSFLLLQSIHIYPIRSLYQALGDTESHGEFSPNFFFWFHLSNTFSIGTEESCPFPILLDPKTIPWSGGGSGVRSQAVRNFGLWWLSEREALPLPSARAPEMLQHPDHL